MLYFDLTFSSADRPSARRPLPPLCRPSIWCPSASPRSPRCCSPSRSSSSGSASSWCGRGGSRRGLRSQTHCPRRGLRDLQEDIEVIRSLLECQSPPGSCSGCSTGEGEEVCSCHAIPSQASHQLNCCLVSLRFLREILDKNLVLYFDPKLFCLFSAFDIWQLRVVLFVATNQMSA